MQLNPASNTVCRGHEQVQLPKVNQFYALCKTGSLLQELHWIYSGSCKTFRSGNFSELQYKKLRVSDPNPASFPGLPKVHKPQPDNDHFVISAKELNGVSLRLRKTIRYSSTWQRDSEPYRPMTSIQYGTQQSSCLANREVVSLDVDLLFTSIPVKF